MGQTVGFVRERDAEGVDDGDVAASTQNAAFHALLKFFTLVLKRDMGRIEAIRANKGKQIPTVLSPPEISRVFENLSGMGLVIGQSVVSRPADQAFASASSA